MKTDALLIIDMLNDFVCPDGALYIGETVRKIIPEIQKKLAQYRQAGKPVLYICDAHAPDDREFEMFPIHSVEGSRGAEIHKDLRPNPDDIIVRKQRFSGFFNTDLDTHLKGKNLKRLELCGVCTNICVFFTAADARNRDYEVIVDRRCVDSFDHAAHEFALKEMERVLGVKML